MSDHARTMRSATIKFLARVVPRVEDGKGLVDLTDDIRHLAGGVALSHLPDNSASMTAVKVQAIVIG
ncbi:hypothetical protein HaLaN_19912 [Haematococcus lacustris]|uniref:Uncharacterized protein n=1 Tax=Haematococcus lacustris TaxID=44745 RepID=A0A699ZIM9_HAELA|nr:hypothetical protein HaLaN_19912 [Haematococcus lacustris]